MENESEKTLDVADLNEETAEVTVDEVETSQNEPEVETETASEGTVDSVEVKTDAETDLANVEVNETQSTEENAKYAQIRRKAEEDASRKIKDAETKAFERGKLEVYKGKINPYTEKPITDLADVELYEVMYQLDNEGKDPLKDLPDEMARRRREEAKIIQDKKDLELKVNQEIDDFQKKYPKVDLTELFKDSFFNDYMQGKTKPLIEIYEGFNKFKTSFRNSAVEVAKQTIANAQASPGSLGSEAEVTIDYSNMSSEEFAKQVQMVKDGELK